MRSWPSDRVVLGGDYNPEQWPPEVWEEDVALMREAGVSFVTLGVFSWATLQPEPDRWELDWLDRVMDLLDGAGVAVDLATATASPPPWFSRAHPDTLPVDREGRTLWPGGRQAWCPSSTVFTEHATAVTATLARRYHDHPALAMWHVSNEYGCHNAPCYCDRCAATFRVWLAERYGDVDALNDAWGTAFWSQRYSTLEEVLPPRLAPTHPNPTQVLDYRRFTSDALLRQYLAELDVLRRLSPGVPVTTNFMTLDSFRHLDYPAWTPHVDVVSTDHYLTGALDDPEAELAFAADLTRGLAGGDPWLLMEHSTSAVNWQPVNLAKRPGQMLRNSLVHVARGADTLGFFQWRASRAGAEKFHSGLVPHAGTGTRLWDEVSGLGRACRALGEVVGTRVEAEVALLWDYQAGWACDQEAHPSSRVRYGDVAHDLHAALRRAHVTVDVVPPGTDLTGYRLVLVPTLYLCSDTTAAAVADAAAAGAHVVVTYFSGIVDENDHVRLGGYPGAFRDLLGVHVEELLPLADDAVVHVSAADGGDARGGTGTLWTEHLHLRDARAVLAYDDGPVPGVPAVTHRTVPGSGAGAWYVATRLDAGCLDALTARVCEGAGVAAAADAPTGVEVVRRRGSGRSYLFAVNHGDEPARVEGVRGVDLLVGGDVDGLDLAAGGVAVVRES
ncbi:beta-galactosidase [Thalassiella azotivora]